MELVELEVLHKWMSDVYTYTTVDFINICENEGVMFGDLDKKWVCNFYEDTLDILFKA